MMRALTQGVFRLQVAEGKLVLIMAFGTDIISNLDQAFLVDHYN